MKKQDLNVFNISFLDLMTGAFAAVIILFIVVPKLNVEDKAAIEKLQQLKVDKAKMDSLLANLKSFIPQKEYEALAGHSVKMQSTMGELERDIEKLRADLAKERQEKKLLQERMDSLASALAGAMEDLEEKNRGLSQLAGENETLRKRIARLEKQLEKVDIVPEKDSASVVAYKPVTKEDTVVNISNIPKGSGDFFIGFNPQLAVGVSWDDSKRDVDLYLKKGDDLCYNYVRNRNMPFGDFVNPKKRGWFALKNSEVIAQEKKLVQGEYQILLHQVAPKDGSTPVRGFVIFAPPGEIARKLEFTVVVPYSKATPYRGGGGTLAGRLVVSEKGANLFLDEKAALVKE